MASTERRPVPELPELPERVVRVHLQLRVRTLYRPNDPRIVQRPWRVEVQEVPVPVRPRV